MTPSFSFFHSHFRRHVLRTPRVTVGTTTTWQAHRSSKIGDLDVQVAAVGGQEDVFGFNVPVGHVVFHLKSLNVEQRVPKELKSKKRVNKDFQSLSGLKSTKRRWGKRWALNVTHVQVSNGGKQTFHHGGRVGFAVGVCEQCRKKINVRNIQRRKNTMSKKYNVEKYNPKNTILVEKKTMLKKNNLCRNNTVAKCRKIHQRTTGGDFV